ncbi:MAG: LptF/LptG family permease [Rickettsiales bacterium]|jgi:lipopolysaccharide export LptBFGC system permease protein LptF|nr:LptF/LptG family permease [Rickettsiales bacterium]
MSNGKNNFFSGILVRYLIKNFIKVFLVLYLSILFLVFVIDYVEFLSKDKNQVVPLWIGLKVIIYRVPQIVSSLSQFLVLLTSAIVIKKMSLKNELTIFYVNGFSLWKIILIFLLPSLIISLISIFIMTPFFIKTSKISKKIELFYTKNESSEFIEEKNGIWFEQINMKNMEKMILRASKVYVGDMIFKDNIMLIFDEDGDFLKRLDIEELRLFEGFWLAKNVFVTERGKPIFLTTQLTIGTNLKKDFVIQRLRNRYENINYMSIYQLMKFNRTFKEYKLDYHKFLAKINIIFSIPLTFMFMCFISAVFITNNVRKNSTLIDMFKIVAIGIIFFIIQNTINEIVLAEKIPIFYIWYTFVLFFVITFYFLIKKIDLANF